jgi:hypothetical protein
MSNVDLSEYWDKKIIISLKEVADDHVVILHDYDDVGIHIRDDMGVPAFIPYTSIVMFVDRDAYIKAHPEGKE